MVIAEEGEAMGIDQFRGGQAHGLADHDPGTFRWINPVDQEEDKATTGVVRQRQAAPIGTEAEILARANGCDLITNGRGCLKRKFPQCQWLPRSPRLVSQADV